MQHKFFAHKKDGAWTHIYPHAGLVNMCGNDKVISVTITERPDLPLPTNDKEFCYVGWKNTPDSKPTMIFSCLLLLNMCFPYGMQTAIKSGQGLPIVLEIESDEDEISV